MNNKIVNILVGGKFGDFIIALYGVRGYCSANNCKANVYLIDIGWEYGIDNIYRELYNILIGQDYINKFEILPKYAYHLDPIQTPSQNSSIQIFDKRLIEEGYIFNDYITSSLLYKKCWFEIYSHKYDFTITSPTSWIKHNKINNDFIGKVIVHRKHSPERFNPTFPYEELIDKYSDSLVFASTKRQDYENFKYTSKIPYYEVKDIDDWFTIINSCSMFVGNLTGPVTIAEALEKLRIVELPHNGDMYHWMGAETYTENLKWYLTDKINNLI
jgi:hypothetical protein